MQKKESYSFLVVFLWMSFFVLTVAILYLSLQDGIEAKAQMYKIIEYISRYVDVDVSMQGEEVNQYIYLLRQGGRFVAFFLLGVLGTVAVHVTFRRVNWLFKTCITAAFPVALAYVTEKVKVYLPTRHYSRDEMLISIAAAILGFMLVSAITFIVWIIKGFVHLAAKKE